MIEKIELGVFPPSDDNDRIVRFTSGYRHILGAYADWSMVAHIQEGGHHYVGVVFVEQPIDEPTAKTFCLNTQVAVLSAFCEAGMVKNSANPMNFLSAAVALDKSRQPTTFGAS